VPISSPDRVCSPTILLVENEASVRIVVQKALVSAGFQVLLAEDGASGVLAFQEHCAQIDLVLLDLGMPTMNGAECFARLKEIEASVRVVVMSGSTLSSQRETLLEQGCYDFLRKPFQLSELLLTVNKALSS
jgi:two-component system, cell cycle sensor histidine kinase and response regulator CckA